MLRGRPSLAWRWLEPPPPRGFVEHAVGGPPASGDEEPLAPTSADSRDKRRFGVLAASSNTRRGNGEPAWFGPRLARSRARCGPGRAPWMDGARRLVRPRRSLRPELLRRRRRRGRRCAARRSLAREEPDAEQGVARRGAPSPARSPATGPAAVAAAARWVDRRPPSPEAGADPAIGHRLAGVLEAFRAHARERNGRSRGEPTRPRIVRNPGLGGIFGAGRRTAGAASRGRSRATTAASCRRRTTPPSAVACWLLALTPSAGTARKGWVELGAGLHGASTRRKGWRRVPAPSRA